MRHIPVFSGLDGFKPHPRFHIPGCQAQGEASEPKPSRQGAVSASSSVVHGRYVLISTCDILRDVSTLERSVAYTPADGQTWRDVFGMNDVVVDDEDREIQDPPELLHLDRSSRSRDPRSAPPRHTYIKNNILEGLISSSKPIDVIYGYFSSSRQSLATNNCHSIDPL
eukprot:1392059-Amorphochlora_amoeboformis.AAC.1